MKWERTPDAPAAAPPAAPALDSDALAPPSWHSLVEVMWHFPRLLAGLGPLGPRGPVDGPPVLVVPGFLATDRTTMDLRRALARGGWRAHPWLMGMNKGAKIDTLDLMCSRLDAIYDGRPVLLVGWSLGGMFVREMAYRCPDRIRAVVTMGTPFSGDLKTNTNIREFYERIAGHDVNLPPFERHQGKLAVPSLSFWSRRDGIVAPAAARGDGEVDKSVEIDTLHMGFAVDRPALSRMVREIAIFLTAIEGKAPVMGKIPVK
ncbi:alpha/beta hydrolase [Sphingomonas sp.]|uniref:alpha/beta hydrolase family protein n=1 Tax=Sphingomonas sp. TaxID=28214 RepID=UPI00286B1F49|nr:alpha/beta hydrolase [Sphingomonas sp.]